jgi:hypothetical protein
VEKAKSKEVKELLQQINQRDSLTKSISEKEAAISSTLKERGAASVRELEKRLGELVGKKRKSGKRNCWNSKKKSQKLTPHGNSSIQNCFK